MPIKVDASQKKVYGEAKSKDFTCGLSENVPRIKFSKQLHMKRKHNEKTIQYTQSPANRKVGYTRFARNS